MAASTTISWPIMQDSRSPSYYNDMEKRPSWNEKHMQDRGHDTLTGFYGHAHGDHGHPVVTELSWKGRLKHFTFANYAFTMSLGGVALVLSIVPNRADFLTPLGTGLFVLNIILFSTITILLLARFWIYPETLLPAFTNPHEGFFFATFWLSFATMLTNSVAYGIPNSGPWLIDALRVAFYAYTVCVSAVAIFYYYVLFTVHKLVITNVLPGWILPIFPAMLVGTLAGAIAKFQTPENAYLMLAVGFSYQGLGMMFAMMIYPLYFGRMLTSGLPADQSRPAMFIAVGPPAFTALALINMAQDAVATQIFTSVAVLPGITNPQMINDLLQILALLVGVGFLAFAAWTFAVAVIATFEAAGRNDFHLNWYAYVFPNVGFTIAVIKIGERLNSTVMGTIGTIMGATLFFLLFMVFFFHMRAISQHMIMWPGKDEDAAH